MMDFTECSRPTTCRGRVVGGNFVCVQEIERTSDVQPGWLKHKRYICVWMDQGAAGDSGKAQTVQ